ncbi:MAG: fibronectin type III domain-containing protein, partial [Clostridiales Family XIII bacterium]|nr:fibronectin type III domain-containing protein [Clostridiales Family XIII bacterium]
MNTKRIFKQILPMLLSVVLVIGLTPATAFAVETPPADPVPADLTANEAPVTEDAVTDSAPAEEVPEENEPKQELSALAGVNDGSAEGIILQIAKFNDNVLAPYGESLNATSNTAEDTVTITGNITHQDETLVLCLTNIKVVWKATSRSKLTDGPLVTLQISSDQYYSGTFELADGGVLWNECYGDKDLPAIKCRNIDLIVNGGIVRSDYGSAILEEYDGVRHRYVHDYGESYLMLEDTGKLQVKSGDVISLYGPNGAINATCAIKEFSITGGRVWSVSTAAITLKTSLTVNDSAIVQSDSDTASAIVVNSSGHTVNVRGAGIVRATGQNRNAIFSSQSNTTISVSGGVVENTGTGNGILLTGTTSKLTVSGSGRVYSAALNAIKIQGTKAELTVKDSAQISADGSESTIYFPQVDGVNDGVGTKINISGGEISAAGRYAIHLDDDHITLTVSGNALIESSVYSRSAVNVSGTSVDIVINGGIVRGTASNVRAITVSGSANTLTMNGGLVETSGYGSNVIDAEGGLIITLNGGRVISPGGVWVIRNTGGGSTTIGSNAYVDGAYDNNLYPSLSAPSAPLDVTARAGNAQATVNWSEPVGNGGDLVTGYIVTASPGGKTVTTGKSQTTATITGLTNAALYTFTVQATNHVGTSVASAASNTVIPTGDYVISNNDITTFTASMLANKDRIVVRTDNATIKSSGDITLPPIFVDQSDAKLCLDGRGAGTGPMKIVDSEGVPAISIADDSSLSLSVRGKVSVTAQSGRTGILVPGSLRISNGSQATDEAPGELTVSGGAYGIKAGDLKVDRNDYAGLKLNASATDTGSRGLYTETGDFEATDAILTVTATASGSSAIWSSYGLKIYGGLTTATGHDSGIYARALGKDSIVRNDADNIIITKGSSDPVVNATATGNSSSVENAPICTPRGGMTIEHARITADARNPEGKSLVWSIVGSPAGSGIIRDCEITANAPISFEANITITDSTIDMPESQASSAVGAISAGLVLTIANCDIDVHGYIRGNTYAGTNSITDSDITVRSASYGITGSSNYLITDSNLILNDEGPGSGLLTRNLTIRNSMIEVGSLDVANDYDGYGGIYAGDILIDNSTVHVAKSARGIYSNSGSLSISGASEVTAYAGSGDAVSLGA